MSKISLKKGIIFNSGSYTSFSCPAATFTAIPLTAYFDPFNKFNSIDTYNAPYSGYFHVSSKIRLADFTNLTSYGQSANNELISSVWFYWIAWAETNISSSNRRNYLENNRILYMNMNDPLRLYVYADIAVSVSSAELSIIAL